jgi:predicted GNAT superfamily acetyltransferase
VNLAVHGPVLTPRVRPMHTQDFDAVLRINSVCLPHVAKLDREYLICAVASISVALVATDGVTISGYLLAISSAVAYEGEEFRCFLDSASVPFLFVDQIAVCPACRGTGVASALYASAEQRAIRFGLQALGCGINVLPSNPDSIHLHDKLGFEFAGKLRTRANQVVALMRKDLARRTAAPVAANLEWL